MPIIKRLLTNKQTKRTSFLPTISLKLVSVKDPTAKPSIKIIPNIDILYALLSCFEQTKFIWVTQFTKL